MTVRNGCCNRALIATEHIGAPEHDHQFADSGDRCCPVGTWGRGVCTACRAQQWRRVVEASVPTPKD